MNCSHTDDILRAFSAGRLHEEPLLSEHLGRCTLCAREVLRTALSRETALDEDTVAFYLTGLATPAEEEQVAQAMAGSPEIRSHIQELQAEGDATSTIPGPRSWWRPLLRSSRQTWSVLAAAALVLLVGGGVWLLLPRPGEQPLGPGPWLPRGTPAEVELTLGDRVCPALPPEGPAPRPCTWDPQQEDLGIHYRLEPGSTLRHLAVAARDSTEDCSALFPRAADAQPWSTAEVQPTPRSDGLCRQGFCWLEGGRYTVPAGPLEIRALFTTAPLTGPALQERIWQVASPPGEEVLLLRFTLTVEPRDGE